MLARDVALDMVDKGWFTYRDLMSMFGLGKVRAHNIIKRLLKSKQYNTEHKTIPSKLQNKQITAIRVLDVKPEKTRNVTRECAIKAVGAGWLTYEDFMRFAGVSSAHACMIMIRIRDSLCYDTEYKDNGKGRKAMLRVNAVVDTVEDYRNKKQLNDWLYGKAA